MVRRNRRRTIMDDIGRVSRSVLRTGVGIGVGGAVLAGVGAKAPGAPSVAGSLTTTARFLPIATTATIGFHAIKNLRRIEDAGRIKHDKEMRKRARGPEQYGYD